TESPVHPGQRLSPVSRRDAGPGRLPEQNLAKARRYPINHPENDKAVIKVRVNVGKVIAINYQGHPRQKTWHDHGYDTAWVPPRCGMVRSGLEEDCVWDPRRIQILKVILPEEGPNYGLILVDVGEVMAINGLDQKTWQDSGYDSTWEPHVTFLTTPAGEVIGNRSGNGSGNGSGNRSGNVSGTSELKMYREWEEDDFDLSTDEGELGLREPHNGRTYIMYHGTTRQKARCIQARGFRQSPDGMLGRGVYLSRDLAKVRRYPIDHPENDKAVIKVRVNVGKVIAINYQDHPLRKTWHDHGYDTAWVPPRCGMVRSGLEEDCVWDPRCIEILKVILP
ncbi:hypothetical protein D4764_18G0011940, partial [Takifugu flavidus]